MGTRQGIGVGNSGISRANESGTRQWTGNLFHGQRGPQRRLIQERVRSVWVLVLVAYLAILAAPSTLRAAPIDSPKAQVSPDGKTLWFDGKDLLVEGKGWRDTASVYDRLPRKAQGKVPPRVWNLSHDSAGLCIHFTTDSPTLRVRWSLTKGRLGLPDMPSTGVSGIDLYFKNASGRWQYLSNEAPFERRWPTSTVGNEATFSPPPGQECLLYLPLYNGTASVEIGIPKDRTISSPEASNSRRKPIVWYGTSIVQGACASRPGMAATAIVGRKLDTEIINLGFAGSGRMEPEMADLLAELDPSVYILDCLWNMEPKEVSERVEPFVKRLREAHPDTSILLAEDSHYQNLCPTAKGRVLRDCFERLITAGVENIHFLPSKNMLGDDGEGTVEGCHPNDLGMMRQAEVFVQALRPLASPLARPRESQDKLPFGR